MKKILTKILVVTLIFGSIGLGTFTVKPDEASAATKTVFYAHPSKAKKIGWKFSTTKTISRSQLIKISDYFDKRKGHQSAWAGLAATILSAPLNVYASVPAGAAVTLLTSYSKTHGDLISAKLKKSTKKSFKVKITYRYRQAGSNQGYYYIDSIKIY
ncbi:hypothetical protein JUJ52_03190 [Virgibacillus sp. AGTR]|uniref:hypothetical protein n=1 Tax=Virgibacillus sp. AGTR TaxID=2812055 RepID=UPI001D16FAAC|nr:hypothetical protein [Virgibacillus sp. AGTR]MCC2248963.1 hypothetical protein [Virgibacillus sp. AGTR]